MSLVDDVSGEQTEQLAVLFCDVSQADAGAAAETEIAQWRVNYFRAAREIAADYGGHETTTAAGGWVATFTSTLEALVCARALSSLVGWQTGGLSLSGGLSAGDIVRDARGIDGSAVREAIALCRRARPRQVLIADPLRVVVTAETAGSFAPAPLAELAELAAAGPWARAGTGTRTGPWIGSGPRAADSVVDFTAPIAMGPGMFGRVGARAVPAQRPVDASGRHGRHSRSWHIDRRPEAERVATERSLRLITDTGKEAPAPITEDTSGLRLTLLGWVQLESGEPPVRLAVMRGSQARAVLSMLALRPGPVHKDELAELLWPSALPHHWEGALRGLVTKIRRFLDAGGVAARDALVGDGGYYELRLPPGVTVDRDVATALVVSAEAALAQGRPLEAVALVGRAATILERRLLSGTDNAWFDQIRAELVRDRLTALELCARAELATGGVEAAKRAAAAALVLDPFRESSYRLLMEAHAAAGSRGEALRTYERCRRMLADELGVGPAPQTQALYVHMLG